MESDLVPGHELKVLLGEHLGEDIGQVVVVDEIGLELIREQIWRIEKRDLRHERGGDQRRKVGEMHSAATKARYDIFLRAELPVDEHPHPDITVGYFLGVALEIEPLLLSGRARKRRAADDDLAKVLVRTFDACIGRRTRRWVARRAASGEKRDQHGHRNDARCRNGCA